MNGEGHRFITDHALRDEAPGVFKDSQIELVIEANHNTDHIPYCSADHFDNSDFAPGIAKIDRDWACILQEANRFSLASLRAFGTMLHTVQDFYAHSTWVELHLDTRPMPLWDFHLETLPADIVSGAWPDATAGPGRPAHCEINKDSGYAINGKTKAASGPFAGRSYWDIAYEVAANSSTVQLAQFLDGVTVYRVTTRTGMGSSAGTDADVFLIVHGTLGSTGSLPLDNPDKNDFQGAALDLFVVGSTARIGEVTGITIGLMSPGDCSPGPDWYFEAVSVEIPTLGKNYHFEGHRWLGLQRGDGQTAVDLQVG